MGVWQLGACACLNYLTFACATTNDTQWEHTDNTHLEHEGTMSIDNQEDMEVVSDVSDTDSGSESGQMEGPRGSRARGRGEGKKSAKFRGTARADHAACSLCFMTGWDSAHLQVAVSVCVSVFLCTVQYRTVQHEEF